MLHPFLKLSLYSLKIGLLCQIYFVKTAFTSNLLLKIDLMKHNSTVPYLVFRKSEQNPGIKTTLDKRNSDNRDFP